MSTEVAVRPQASVPAVSRSAVASNLDATDILIPNLYAAQKTSPILDEGVVKFGEILKSTTKEVLGGKGKPVNFIPLTMWKDFIITSGGKMARREPWSGGGYEFEFTENGKVFKRERVLNFFCFLPQEIEDNLAVREQIKETGEMPDVLVPLLPVLISFKGKSYKTGKILVSHFANMDDFGFPPYRRSFSLDTVIEQNEKGSYAVLKVADAGAVKDHLVLDTCNRWTDILGSRSVKVDDVVDDMDDVEVGTEDNF